MTSRGDVFSRLSAKRHEQTPQALARLVVVGLFVGLWFVLWLARIPMPVPFLFVLLAEISFFLVYWRTVFLLRSVRAVELAHYGMLASEIVFHTTMVYFLGGLSWLGAFAYVFGLIFANTFLDLRRGLVYTAGASLAFGALVLLEATRTIPHYTYLEQGPLRYTDPAFVTTALLCGSGVFFSIYLWVNWVGHQLRVERDSAVRAQNELLLARADLQRANEGLEARVQARTAQLLQANAALRESQQQLNLVLETCPDLIAMQEADATYRFVNSAFKTVLGYAPSDLIGESPAQFIHPDDLQDTSERFQAMVTSGLPGRAAFRFRHKDGRWLVLEANGQMLVDESGETTGIVVVYRDATERKRAEEALRQSEEVLRATIESTGDGILVVDYDGRVAHVNTLFLEMWRIPNELIELRDDNKLLEFVLDQLVDPEAFLAKVRELYQTADDSFDTLRFHDGRVFERFSRPLVTDNEVSGRVWSFRDATERKRADDALRESESKFRTMAETVAAATFIFQGEKMRYVNSAAEAITGYSRDELLGMNFWDVIHPEFRGLVTERGLARQRGEQVPARYETKLLTKAGRERWVDFTAGITEFDGKPAVLGTAFDITERKWAEDALREQARRDPLTGLLNHAAIVDELRDVITASGREAMHAVAMVDVDGLKAVNDTYGHQMGDLVLLAVGKALARDGAVVGRYGGDEFVALLKSADRAAAERYRASVVGALAGASLIDAETGAAVPVVVSIGLAVYPDEAETIEELIRLSDTAMYTWRRQRVLLPGELRSAGPLGRDQAAEMIGELVPLLTSSGELNDKLRMVAQKLSVGAGYDGVNFALFPDQSGPPVAANTFARTEDQLVEAWDREQRDEAGLHPIRAYFEQTRRPVIMDDPWHDQRLLAPQRELLRAAGLASVLVAPMLWQDQVVGSLGVASKQEHAFTSRDAQFLAAVASQVTAIVQLATLVEKLQASASRLSDAQTDTVLLLASVAEARDRTTGRHLQNVRVLAEALARELGHSDDQARMLGLAATLHDIGKIRVPDGLLDYSGPLDEAQWQLMKQHTTWGAELLAGRPAFELAATIARCHHERWDGSGYPAGLALDAIPEPAAIVAVADAFDAIVNGRPYSQPRPVAHALREISRCAGGQFSPRVVEALQLLHKRRRLPITAGRPHKHAA